MKELNITLTKEVETPMSFIAKDDYLYIQVDGQEHILEPQQAKELARQLAEWFGAAS